MELGASGGAARQLSIETPTGMEGMEAQLPGGSLFALLVLAKRTYAFDVDGRIWPAESQVHLYEDCVDDPASPLGLMLHDSDLYPFKPLTDVVVLGHAYPRRGERSFEAAITIGKHRKVLSVLGERSAGLDHLGRVRFSDAQPFTGAVPLTMALAYGGSDVAAEARYGNPYEEARDLLGDDEAVAEASPYRYPRNPFGRGYLVEVTRASFDHFQLPQLEEPTGRLHPEQLAAGSPDLWPRMPLPWTLGWQEPSLFPRCACAGLPTEHAPLSQHYTEVRRGFYPKSVFTALLADSESDPDLERVSPYFANGASLGLARRVGPGEAIELVRLHPSRENVRFNLPNVPPRLFVDGREGALLETRPRLHSVVVEPDAGRFSLLWAGIGPARRPYTAEELETMPFKALFPPNT